MYGRGQYLTSNSFVRINGSKISKMLYIVTEVFFQDFPNNRKINNIFNNCHSFFSISALYECLFQENRNYITFHVFFFYNLPDV